MLLRYSVIYTGEAILVSEHFIIDTKSRLTEFVHTYDRTDATPQFPVSIRDAAMTTLKSPRLGLNSPDEDMHVLLPPGDGFIYLPEHEQHFFVAHYHQLHCLRSFRQYFLKKDQLDEGDIGHIDHCMLYLHQSVLCNVDVTLEPATHKQLTPDGRITNAVTGMGVTHQCKDWTQVREYMEENYAKWEHTYWAAGTYPGNSTGSSHRH